MTTYTKILVIQKKRIGDVLTSTVLFKPLKEKYPNAKLVYLVYQNSTAVVENNPYIDEILVLDEATRKSKLLFLKFLLSIRRKRFDLVIDAYSKPNSVIISFFTGAKNTIGFEKKYSKILLKNVINRDSFKGFGANKAIQDRLGLLQPIGINCEIEQPKIYLTKSEIESAKNKMIQAGLDFDKNIVMISVLGTQDIKTYPSHYMTELLNIISKKLFYNIQILFNYIPWQKEQALAIYNACNEDTKKTIFFDFFQDDLREFLAVLKNCNAIIGNEGGAINMSKALEIPNFCIFSPGIKKMAWNVFENGTTNVSVHIDDYNLELTSEDIFIRYNAFSPNIFEKELNNFMSLNLLKHDKTI